MAITMRKGAYADFDPSKMKAGEWAVSTDTDTTKQQIWMCFAPGVVKRMGTVEDFDTEIQTLIKQYLDGMAESVEKAQESAELATSKAQESSDSADKAKASEDKAKEYEESAYSTITTINEAAEATRLNKEAAAQSEANAKASENEALSYKNSASDSEQASKTSETNAKTYADNASASATSASTSATDASESKTSASASASQAKTSETNAKTSEINSAKNESEAQKYAEQAKEISESLSGALRPLGTINFADLPTTAESTAGDMYNIADQFTTTADFKEGSGNVIPAGSNVYLTVDRYWDVLAGTPVTGVKGAKENYYRRGNVDITPANIGAIAEDGDISDTTVTFADTTTRVNLASGEKVAVGFGKIKKWLADLKSFAFNDLVNNLTTSTTGSALDASQGKILNDRCDELNQSLNLYADYDEHITPYTFCGKTIYRKLCKMDKLLCIADTSHTYDEITKYYPIADNIDTVWLKEGFYYNNANSHSQPIPFISRIDTPFSSFQLQVSPEGYIAFVVMNNGLMTTYTDVSGYFVFYYTKL